MTEEGIVRRREGSKKQGAKGAQNERKIKIK
jgi:hypothetical protein